MCSARHCSNPNQNLSIAPAYDLITLTYIKLGHACADKTAYGIPMTVYVLDSHHKVHDHWCPLSIGKAIIISYWTYCVSDGGCWRSLNETTHLHHWARITLIILKGTYSPRTNCPSGTLYPRLNNESRDPWCLWCNTSSVAEGSGLVLETSLWGLYDTEQGS